MRSIFDMFDKLRRYIDIDAKIRYSIFENAMQVRYIENIEVLKYNQKMSLI